ncbi:MAG: HAD-IB family phosphatase [Bacteroidota bacterium]|nr:HAD-IB family phosphatase [Chitinophagaceae bacterium]MDZ4809360.1 HAD-IB family phosphatase [Bacteroidota bacterium]
MVTVIIPALNEEKTIRQVVHLANNSANVSEVIVVDDKSMDNTVAEARKEGATVITSTKLGKGASMKDGILVAKNEIIAFLDADIITYPNDVVELLTQPLVTNKADFVKSYFARQAGRVTELVAKPLLSILYPTFPNFKQPLSGMIAGKKSLFAKIEFEEGYGVDIGILIDMHNLGAKIAEVSIGNIENRMQPLEQLGKMSREVARAIMKKSRSADSKNLETYENIQIIREQMEFAIREGLMSLKKIAVFDMDNTILRTSFINTAAEKYGFKRQLVDIVTNNNNPFIRTKLIVALLKGKSIGDILELTDSIEVTPHLQEIVAELKKQGYITGIISDSYDCVTNHLKNKFGFDFTISNELEFSRSFATGEVKIPSLFVSGEDSQCKHDYCKLNALIKICGQYKVDLKNTLMIGDGENDICCLKKAGIAVSFCSTSNLVDSVADYVIKEPDFKRLIPILE